MIIIMCDVIEICHHSIVTYANFVRNYLSKTGPRTVPSMKETFESILGKGENAGNQHFLLFLQCF